MVARCHKSKANGQLPHLGTSGLSEEGLYCCWEYANEEANVNMEFADAWARYIRSNDLDCSDRALRALPPR